MKTRILILGVLFIAMAAAFVLSGCAATEKVTSKVGAQLWGENCLRCHNAPDPTDYSDAQWEAVGDHMKLRATTITDEERDKIVEFLKSAN